MHEVDLLLSLVLGSLRERRPLLLRQDAVLADLLDVVDRRQPLHHLTASELAQRLEVEVAVTLMPVPRHVADPCGEAHRGSNVHVEEVEPAW
jgi:hypothetical protein